jgi:hypothetical protein
MARQIRAGKRSCSFAKASGCNPELLRVRVLSVNQACCAFQFQWGGGNPEVKTVPSWVNPGQCFVEFRQ